MLSDHASDTLTMFHGFDIKLKINTNSTKIYNILRLSDYRHLGLSSSDHHTHSQGIARVRLIQREIEREREKERGVTG